MTSVERGPKPSPERALAAHASSSAADAQGREMTLRIDTLVRDRLFADVVDGMPPLLLVHAPAGYGKSVAALHLTTALRERGVAVGSLSCPREADGGSGAPALWAAMSEALDGDGSANTFEKLVSKAARLAEPLVLVLDDYQWVTGMETDLMLAKLLTGAPGLSLVVISRRLVALDGPMVRSHVTTVSLTEEQLRFSEEETARFAEQHGIVRRELHRALQEFCDGWPLVVSGVIRELDPAANVDHMIETASRYAQQMFDMFRSAKSRRVLLAALAGDAATPRRIAKLVKLDPAECLATLASLETYGMVRRVWHGDGQRFLAHAGVRRPLARLAVEEFGEQRLRRWQVKNALEVADIVPETAYATLLGCGAYAEAADLLTRRFLTLMSRPEPLLHLMRGVPEPVLFDVSVFIACRLLLEQLDPDSDPAMVKKLFERLRLRVAADLAEDGIEGDLARQLVALGALAVAERMRGSGDSLRLARELQRRLDANRGDRLAALERTLSFMYAVAAFGGHVNGDLDLTERAFRATLAVAERLGNADEQLRGLYGLASTAAFAGRMGDAERYLERADAFAEATSAAPPHMSWTHRELARMLVAIERVDAAAFDDSLAVVLPRLDRIEQWPLFLIAEVSMERLVRGERRAFEMMERRKRQIGGLFTAAPFMRASLDAGIATMHMLVGDYAQAERRLAELPEAHPKAGLARARLRLLMGDPERARARAARVRGGAAQPRYVCDALLLIAVAAAQLDDLDGALDAAAEATAVMAENGFWSPVGLVPYSKISAVAELLAERRGDDRLRAAVAAIPEIARFEPLEDLSRAERRIIAALPEHETIAAIAEELFLSQNTVKSHLKNVYRKLRVTKRIEAIERARQIGLIAPTSDVANG